MGNGDEVRWLSSEQQQSWRAYIMGTELLQHQLDRELREEHDISFSEYEILVRLSESPGRSLRMSHLASHTLASRSRLSHQVDRLERAGLVERQACESDRRGANAVLTDLGWSTLVEAAPTHVEGVRRHLVDRLTDEQFADLGDALSIVAKHLQGLEPDCESSSAGVLTD